MEKKGGDAYSNAPNPALDGSVHGGNRSLCRVHMPTRTRLGLPRLYREAPNVDGPGGSALIPSTRSDSAPSSLSDHGDDPGNGLRATFDALVRLVEPRCVGPRYCVVTRRHGGILGYAGSWDDGPGA
jgi:hypothetical protein